MRIFFGLSGKKIRMSIEDVKLFVTKLCKLSAIENIDFVKIFSISFRMHCFIRKLFINNYYRNKLVNKL